MQSISPAVPQPNLLVAILLPLLCIVGFLGNLLICMAIWLDRRLHNVTNYFLFSLALADLCVCTVVMPISFMVELHQGHWQSGFELCLLYVYSDVFLCTASIVHMSVISLDRYLGISKPLEMRNRSKTMITLKIMFVWMVTVLISCPIAVAALIDPTNILEQSKCVITNRYYMIYGSTFAFLIPFVIMAVTYVKTTNLLNKQAALLSQTAIQRSHGEGLRRTLPRRPAYPSAASVTSHKISTSSDHHIPPARLSAPIMNSEDELRLLDINGDENGQGKENKLRRLCVRTSSVFLSITSKFGHQNSQKAEEIANEHKATRVLAVVFGCFFVCWTPFFAANLANGFFGDECNIPPTISSLFLWLGYVSSIINPLIYTVFNRRFRQAVVRIIRCNCFKPLGDPSSTNYSRSHVYLPAETNTWTNLERIPSHLNAYGNGSELSSTTISMRNQDYPIARIRRISDAKAMCSDGQITNKERNLHEQIGNHQQIPTVQREI